jgi:glycosyltransferase involved in cell wall biosynthesis
MAQAALDLLTDPERHAAFRTAARRLALMRYDTRLVLPQYEAFYREILAT